MARDVKTQLEVRGSLDTCTLWRMESMESRYGGLVDRLDVGFWTPAGPHLKDDLFPHVKGNFRGRSIPVSSIHVSILKYSYFSYPNYILTF